MALKKEVKKKGLKTKKVGKATKRPALKVKQVLVTEDKRSQEILAQTVIDSVANSQARNAEIKARLGSPTQQEVPPTALDAEVDRLIKYLEDEVLPKARSAQSFTGMAPMRKNGKTVFKQVKTVKELEEVIAEIKNGRGRVLTAESDHSESTTSDVMQKPKGLGFLDRIKKFFNK